MAAPAAAEVAAGKATAFNESDFRKVACKIAGYFFFGKKHNYIDFFAFL